MSAPRTASGSAAEEDFSAFFSARFHQARRLAYLLCGDWHRADDLAQAAFVRIASSWHRIRDLDSLDAYLRTCLMRSFLSDQRRVWRRREAPTADLPEPAPTQDSADAVTTRMTVLRALAQVPPRQRAVLVCRYYDGLDVAGTARVLGCTEGTVKSQAARGLTALRAALADLAWPGLRGPQARSSPPAETPEVVDRQRAEVAGRERAGRVAVEARLSGKGNGR